MSLSKVNESQSAKRRPAIKAGRPAPVAGRIRDLSGGKKQAGIHALRLLAASPKTRRELERKLSDKGYEEAVIRNTLDELERQGLLSDRNFAVDLVSRFIHARPSGARRIRFELKRRGVPAKLQEEVLAQFQADDERGRARELAAERWRRFSHLPVEKRIKRVYDFLIRRGFDFQTARDLIEELEATGITE